MISTAIVLICVDLLTLADGQLGRFDSLDSEPMQKTEMEIPINSTAVQGVAGINASLPCDTQPRDSTDTVTMVLWFKESTGEPVYSYDARKHNGTRLWSAEKFWGSRATFNATTANTGYLQIKDVQESDAGEYRCRVDFRNSPSKNLKVNFTIIVPPLQPIIYDTKKRDMSKHSDAYPEGTDLDLICEVHGGKPLPRVTWYLEMQQLQVLNSTYEVKEVPSSDSSLQLTGNPSSRQPRTVIISRVTINLQRSHHLKKVFCRASNTKLAIPKKTYFTILLYLKPLSVEILGKEKVVSTRHKYTIECQSRGSKPAATLSWYKGTKLLKNMAKNFEESGISRSVLEWIPNAEDEGKYLTCRAENRHLPEYAIESKWQLKVHFAPIVQLRVGSQYKDIKEGDDVYFECNVRSNPGNFNLTWYHGNKEVRRNPSGGVVLSDQSLFLSGLTRDASGNYSCLAANTEGHNRSNIINLHVMFSPVCKHLSPINQRHKKDVLTEASSYHGESENEQSSNLADPNPTSHRMLDLVCEVEANPSNVTFHWTFNASNSDLRYLPQSSFSTENTVSRVSHLLRTSADFGTFSCSASNVVGDAKQACVYHVPTPVKPMPLQNCTAHNQSDTWVRITCVAGSDGGLPQKFVAVVDGYKNVSNVPNWEFEIQKPTTVTLYAFNAKGSSSTVILNDIAFKDVAKYTGETGISLDISPILIGLGGTATGLGLIVTGVLMALWRKAAAASTPGSPSKPKALHQPTSIATFAVKGEEEDGNPDLIPTTALTNSCYTDSKPSVYGSLPRRSNFNEEHISQSTINDLDYPRAAPNTYYSLQRPNRYAETIVRHTTVHESCI